MGFAHHQNGAQAIAGRYLLSIPWMLRRRLARCWRRMPATGSAKAVDPHLSQRHRQRSDHFTVLAVQDDVALVIGVIWLDELDAPIANHGQVESSCHADPPRWLRHRGQQACRDGVVVAQQNEAHLQSGVRHPFANFLRRRAGTELTARLVRHKVE